MAGTSDAKEDTGGMQDLVVAAAQFQNENSDKETNLGRIRALTQKAAGLGADVVSFHEGCVTGYTFVRKLPRSELLELSEPVPGGESKDRLARVAGEYGVHLLAVRVLNIGGMGGIWRPVHLILSNQEMTDRQVKAVIELKTAKE